MFLLVHTFWLRTDLIAQMSERLTSLTEEVKSCSQTPGEALGKAVGFLIDDTHKYINGNYVVFTCLSLWPKDSNECTYPRTCMPNIILPAGGWNTNAKLLIN